jgi:PTH2 family peptidyl-tRNA hydrolase
MTEYAVYILMRTDLNMSRGKMCAQAGHAVTDLILFGVKDGFEDTIREWYNEQGQTKVTLAVNRQAEIEDIMNQCIQFEIPYSEIWDEGRTEFNDQETLTVLGIGPVERKIMNPIIGHLQALR